MPLLARIDLTASKDVFVSAIRFATSISGPCPQFGDKLKTSAQEQVEYMLGEDENAPLVLADKEVKLAITVGLCNISSAFEKELSSLPLVSNSAYETTELRILHVLSDLEWMCNMLPKMDLMEDFVSNWVESSSSILGIIEDQKLDSLMWSLKIKLIEMTAKVLEAVGYGSVIIPAPRRVALLEMWLPYIRRMKPLLDIKGSEEACFAYTMSEELCESIEGAIVTIIPTLPSNNQAEIFADWIKSEQIQYPDLSEAFEVWCYRAKSANRRLMEGTENVGSTTSKSAELCSSMTEM